MAATVLKDARLLVGGYEVTSDHNTVALNMLRPPVIKPSFGIDSNVYLPGLVKAEYSLDGWFDSDGSVAIDDIKFAEFNASISNVLTIVAPDGAVGAVAYSFESIDTDYAPFGGGIGDIAAFNVAGTSTGDVLKGVVIEAGTTARTATLTTAEYELGDIVAGEILWAALHVIATTGSPTLDVVIQSDVTGFGSPTPHITFPQATAIGDGFLSSTTAESDTFWRAVATWGGTGSITFLIAFGIQNE